MKKLFLLAVVVTAMTMQAQKPQIKVDINFSGRSDEEVLEPGYTAWAPGKDIYEMEKTIDGVTFKFTSADGHIFRNDWNKTFIQNADNKAKNGRLLGDGIMLDPTTDEGAFILTITGLPAGQHTFLAYHNSKDNPATTDVRPMNVKLGENIVCENLKPTIQEIVAANAGISTVTFSVTGESDVVEIVYTTVGIVDPETDKATIVRSPIINGFELNTVNVATQAKNPYPTSGNMHADCDGGTCTLTWEAAGDGIKQHLLFIGTDEEAVAGMTTPTATLAANELSYTVNGLYNLNTYYWRVDEVDANGTVIPGQIWSFKPRHLAFPGAEGYGRFAIGGRGGQVYRVTNLDGGITPGSFAYGLTQVEGPRTIVFDVSGIIDMEYRAYFVNPNVTIAAQTAPGKGICLMHSNINIGADNICRHLRAKRGYGGADNTGNAMGCTGADHTIIDHTTAAWGTDETYSSRGAKNISFQYSMIAEALGIADHKNYGSGTNHGFAATIDGKIGTYSHNLLVNCNGRNWSMGGGMDGENRAIGQMDIFNNVCYNWWGRTTDGNCHELNFVNNYYKMGPDTKRQELLILQYENIGHPSSTWQAYVSGNIRENKNHTLTQDKKDVTYTIQLSNGDPGPQSKGYEPFVNEPFFPSYATIHKAEDALKIVTSAAGATMPCRDDQHVRVVRETVEGTYTYVGSKSGIKGEIDREDDCGGYEAYPEETRAADFDTDQDGMPNWYEELIGSNPNEANHNDDPDRDGYTLLEDYLDFMAHPYLVIKAGESATFDVSQEFRGFTKSPVYTFESESNICSASLDGKTISVNGLKKGLTTITLKVKDAEGTEWQQRLGVAVTDNPAAIHSIWSEDGLNVAKREFFTLDGKKVTTLKSRETYIMHLTDTGGNLHSVKIIKN